MRIVTPDGKNGIYLGRQGENLATQVQFDVNVAGWVETYGVGTWQLLNRRPSDPTGYPVEISVEDNIIKWDLTATDLKYAGCGTCELVYYVDEVIAKSIIYGTQILPAIDGTGEIPEPWQPWYDDVMEARDEALEAAADAEEARVAIEDMTATAEIDDMTGTPTVVVTKTTVEDPGGTTHENLDFAFSGLKSAADMEAAVYDPDGSVAEAGGIADYVAGETSGLAPESEVQEIKDLIPNQASPENQLADKNFVNSSISTNTANYISNNGQPFTSVEQLEAYSGPVSNNDYAFVAGTDSAGNKFYDRYKATVSEGVVSWAFEYRLNNSSFTAAQWAAIESGITASQVADYNAHLANRDNPHSVTKEQVGLGNVDNTSDSQKPVSQAQAAALALKADKVVDAVAGDFAALDASGNLTDSGISPSDLELVKDVSNDPASSSFDIAIQDGQPAPVLSAVLKGKTVAINQLVKNGNFADTSNWSGYKFTLSASGNKLTATAQSGVGTTASIYQTLDLIAYHYYYTTFTITSSKAITVRRTLGGAIVSNEIPANTRTVVEIVGSSNAVNNYLYLYLNYNGVLAEGDTVVVENVNVVDLTRCGFSTAEATDVATLKAAWLNKYGVPLPQYIPYNAGSIVSNNATYQLAGKNLLDISAAGMVNGERLDASNGDVLSRTYYARSNNYFPIKPSTQYAISYVKTDAHYTQTEVLFYDVNKEFISGVVAIDLNDTLGQKQGNFTTPANAAYLRFSFSKGYSNVQIELGTTATTYEPYHDGGSIVADSLNGFEGTEIFDTQSADGQTGRKVELLDLGSKNWYYDSGAFVTTSAIGCSDNNICLCGRYEKSNAATIGAQADKTVRLSKDGSKVVIIKDSTYGNDNVAFRNAMNGVYLAFELATPTTETVTGASLETKGGYNLLRPVSGDLQSGEVSMTYVKSSYLAKLIAWIRSIL